jgi:hypothetical protein
MPSAIERRKELISLAITAVGSALQRGWGLSRFRVMPRRPVYRVDQIKSSKLALHRSCITNDPVRYDHSA